MVVQTRPQNIAAEVCVRTGAGHAAAAAKIDIEIFELGADIMGDCSFNTGAERPAAFGCIAGTDAGDIGADVTERETACQVRHEASGAVAEAGAQRAEPTVTGFASRAEARRAAVNIAPVD